jgi:hypothetical protein
VMNCYQLGPVRSGVGFLPAVLRMLQTVDAVTR